MTECSVPGAQHLLAGLRRVGRGCLLVTLPMLCSAAVAEGGLPGGLKTVQPASSVAQPAAESGRPDAGQDATSGPGGAIYSPFAAGRTFDPLAQATAAGQGASDDGAGWSIVGIALMGAAGAVAVGLFKRPKPPPLG